MQNIASNKIISGTSYLVERFVKCARMVSVDILNSFNKGTVANCTYKYLVVV